MVQTRVRAHRAPRDPPQAWQAGRNQKKTNAQLAATDSSECKLYAYLINARSSQHLLKGVYSEVSSVDVLNQEI